MFSQDVYYFTAKAFYQFELNQSYVSFMSFSKWDIWSDEEATFKTYICTRLDQQTKSVRRPWSKTHPSIESGWKKERNITDH